MTSEVFMWLSLITLGAICVGMVFLFGMLRHERVRGITGAISPTLLLMAFFPLMFIFVFVHVRSPLHPQGFLFPPETTPWALVMVGVCAGLCLFFLRSWHKGVYGAVEIAVALIVLVATALSMDANTVVTNTIGFVSAIYVLVRGLTNIAESRSNQKQA